MESREVAKDIFFVSFADERDGKKVLDLEPWSFDRALVVLKPVEIGDMAESEDFCFTKLWIQIHNLPIDGRLCRLVSVGDVGQTVEVENNEKGQCLGEFVRVRVILDVTKLVSLNMIS